MLKLKYELLFEDLYQTSGLKKVDNIFLSFLEKENTDLCHKLSMMRSNHIFSSKEQTMILIELAKLIEKFIIDMFDIAEAYSKVAERDNKIKKLFSFKKKYIQRGVAKERNNYNLEEINANIETIIADLKGKNLYPIDEYYIATLSELDESLKKYIIWAIFHPYGQQKHHNSILFKLQLPKDFNNLLQIQYIDGIIYSNKISKNLRSDFSYSAQNAREHTLNNVNNCIFCHNQEKDSCSRGIKESQQLTGCPLDERISEMNFLKSENYTLAALAIAMIDNPMIAATGHRICNDCMRSCIYQKQDPIDIPAIESKVFQDILELPWGFEIYSLLTRWNPLKSASYIQADDSNHKVLVVGLGPAGFAIAHQLLNSGHIVVAIDGLKIEPIDENLSGIKLDGTRVKFMPIKNIADFFQDLTQRVAGGFGGVMEYGITVRWNKNYLTILRLLLERRVNFRMYGGVMFSANLTKKRALELGFNHIVLATGAGKPILPNIPNIMANGVRTASDFLMSLQLNGAGQFHSIANLQIKLPLLVIGGGLTAVDAATEALVYYQIQVEKYLRLYETHGAQILQQLNTVELAIAEQYLEHGRLLRKTSNREERWQLLHQWGGVKIVYRRSIQQAPSYRLNHEELQHALDEGIGFYEHMIPLEVKTDKDGNVIGLICQHHERLICLDAANIIIAIGTQSSEQSLAYNATFEDNNIIIHRFEDGRSISAIGDCNPLFAGNVVKALASAKYAIQIINTELHSLQPLYNDIFKALDDGLIATIKKVEVLAKDILEIIVKSKFAAEEFHPGQFYRLDSLGFQPGFEPLALTGAYCDKELGEISLIMLIVGQSTYAASLLKAGQIVALMGPTGASTLSFNINNKEIRTYKKILLIGGGLGNAVLLSIGSTLKTYGAQIIYIAGYRDHENLWRLEDIEQFSDIVVWCIERSIITPTRSSDYFFQGNVVEAMNHYAKSLLNDIDLIITIGSDRMMANVTKTAQDLFGQHLPIVASINSPMQCMMKEICGQCIQKHIDPISYEESYIFSCAHQDQDAKCVDFENLRQRLNQNYIQEKVFSVDVKVNK